LALRRTGKSWVLRPAEYALCSILPGRDQPLEQIDLLIGVQQLLLTMMDVSYYLHVICSLTVDFVSEDVDTASLKFLTSDNTAGEEDLEYGVLGFLEETLKFDGLGNCACFDELTRLGAVPDKDHVFKLLVGLRSSFTADVTAAHELLD